MATAAKHLVKDADNMARLNDFINDKDPAETNKILRALQQYQTSVTTLPLFPLCDHTHLCRLLQPFINAPSVTPHPSSQGDRRAGWRQTVYTVP
jgi:hypothetical protein